MAFTVFSVFFSLAIILAANGSTSAQETGREKMREAVIGMLNECKTKVDAAEADVQALMAKKLPTTHAGLCLLECIFTSAKIMKDGKLDKEGTIEALTPALNGDAEKLEKMKEMIDVCEKEIASVDEDGCEIAKTIAECTVKHGKEFGFKFPGMTD